MSSNPRKAKKLLFPPLHGRRLPLPTANFADWDPHRPSPSSSPNAHFPSSPSSSSPNTHFPASPPSSRNTHFPSSPSSSSPNTHFPSSSPSSRNTHFPSSPPSSSAAARGLSPLARFICDSLRRHNGRWCPAFVSDLRKLRRVPPDLVAEVLKHQSDPSISSRFFNWAGSQKGYRHGFSAYNALAHCLARAGRHRAADQVLELMAAHGRPPSEKQFQILLQFHAQAGRPLHAHHLLDKMRLKFKLRPGVFFYNRVLAALAGAGLVDRATAVHRSLLEDGLKEDAMTFMVLAKGLCRAGRVPAALEVLGKMRAELCRPDVFAYTALLKLAAAAGAADGCRRIWAAMAADEVVPDAMAYTLMVKTLCAGGAADEALGLLRETKSRGLVPDRVAYGALVAAMVSAGDLAGAGELVKEMTKEGYRADAGIYGSLVTGFCVVGKRDKAWKLLRRAINDGISPAPETVAGLLSAFSAAGDLGKAEAVAVELAAAGLPIISFLEAFFLAAARGGGGSGDGALVALDLFQRLKQRGFHSMPMYNSLIHGLHQARQPEKAVSIFTAMAAAGEPFPDGETFSAVIPCFIAAGDLPGACKCYRKMGELSLAPTREAYRSLVAGLCRSGEVADAVAVITDCLERVEEGPREFKYALAVLRASRRGKVAEVVAVVEEMVEDGVAAGEAVWAAVIHGFCGSRRGASGSGVKAKEVMEAMAERGVITVAEQVFYGEMVEEHMKKTAAGLVLSGLKFFGLESKLKLTSGRETESGSRN
ncbi:pentatricopeptide repeat (PPR-like) superfamily protein [Wolffia australiana]